MKRLITVFFLLIGLLVVIGVIISQVNGIISFVESEFGPAAEELTGIQRLTYGFRLYLNQQALTQPGAAAGVEHDFLILEGESIASITSRLEQDGIIRDAEALRLYLIYSGLDVQIQAGQHTLVPGQSSIQIARELADPTPGDVVFVILPGWRVEEIAVAIPTSGLEISPEAFITAVYDPSGLSIPDEMRSLFTLEGFLYPGEYKFSREIGLEEMINAFLERFNANVPDGMRQAFVMQGLDLQRAVAAASIVQRESVVSDEMPMIASVLYNRLKSGMQLEMDSTVQYALGYDFMAKSWWDINLTFEDLQVPSPYNTYIHQGLPPGPICNPGSEALEAVAFPQESEYLYFRARCDQSGLHTFALTYEEHLQNACP